MDKALTLILLLCSSAFGQILAPIMQSAPSTGVGTFTLVQKVITSSGTCSSSSSTCAVTVTSTGSGHLGVIVAGSGSGSNITISSISGAGTWVVPAGAHLLNASIGNINGAYVLSTSSGVTTITVTWNSASPGNSWVAFYEYSFTGAAAFLDTGATPINTVNNSASTTPAGAALTISGTSDVIVQGIELFSGNVSSVASPYGNILIGTSEFGGACDNENTSSGSAPTWTISASNTTIGNGMAFYNQ